MDEPAAVRRRQRRVADATARLAVLALAGGQHDPVVAVGGPADDLEPAVGVRHVEQRTVGDPARARRRGCARRRRPRARRSRRRRARSAHVSGSSSSSFALIARRPPSGAHSKASTSTPGVGQGGRRGRLAARSAGRPRRGTGASMSQTCDQPRRRERNASRWPSGDQRGERPPPGLPTTRVDPRAVGLDDPDLVVADVREAPAVGRPLRVGDGLLRRGQLGRRCRRGAAT